MPDRSSATAAPAGGGPGRRHRVGEVGGGRAWPRRWPGDRPGPRPSPGRTGLGRLDGRVPGDGHRDGQADAGGAGRLPVPPDRPGRRLRGVHRPAVPGGRTPRPDRHRRPGPRGPAGGRHRALPAFPGRRPGLPRPLPRDRRVARAGAGRRRSRRGAPDRSRALADPPRPPRPGSTRWPPAASPPPTADGWCGPSRSPWVPAAPSRPSARDSSATRRPRSRWSGSVATRPTSTGASPSGSTV